MSLSQDFVDSPYEFMQQHIVVVTYSNQFTKPAQNVVHAFVVKDDRADVADPPTAQSKVCKLYLQEDPGAPQVDKPSLQVYWCHYDPNKSRATVLGTQHRYMFTPTMTGCTFGVGSQSGDGAVRVSHSNIAQPTVGLTSAKAVIRAQANSQYVALTDKFSRKNDRLNGIVAPYTYMVGDRGLDLSRQATTFGRRSGNDIWQFYSQIYRKLDRTYYHFGVKNFTYNIV